MILSRVKGCCQIELVSLKAESRLVRLRHSSLWLRRLKKLLLKDRIISVGEVFSLDFC